MGCLRLCTFLAFCIALAGAACELKCYVCDDCDILDDSLLKSCPPPVTTSAPSPAPTETSVTADIHTTSSETHKTTTTPPTPTPTTPTATPHANTTQEATSDPTIEELTSDVPTTLDSESTEFSQSTTDGTTETNTDETLESSSEGNQEASSAPTPAETEGASTPKTGLDTQKREFSHSLSYKLQYYCFSMEITVHHKRVKKRGCVHVDEYEDPCTILEQDEANGSTVRNCKVCSQDRCNNTRPLESSMSVLVIVASLLFGICM